MAITQCENGHYFDGAKDAVCPYCAKLEGQGFSEDSGLREQQTVFMQSVFSVNEGQNTEIYGEMVGEDDKTISIFSDEAENWFTVGWLVCMGGPVKGKSYTLHSGRNHAGRSMEMDIVLSDDLLLSREKHFSIVYDPKTNRFYLVAGAGRTYHNEEYLTAENELFEGDRISAGESEYIFIPFCKEERTWASKE